MYIILIWFHVNFIFVLSWFCFILLASNNSVSRCPVPSHPIYSHYLLSFSSFIHFSISFHISFIYSFNPLLSYFSFFFLFFLPFFKDSLIKKGQRKRVGKLVVLEDLSKTWELNEKRDRAAFLEKLFKDGPPAVHKIPNLIQHPIHIENQSSGTDSPHRNIPHIDATTSSSTKYSPRLTPLLFTPALPNSL